VRPTATPGPTFALYTVKKGDTLVRIAKKFKTDGRSIAYWNRVTYPSLDPDSPKYKPDRIEVGWVLMILPNEVVDPEALPELTPQPTPRPTPPPPSADASPSS
jgi:nucleoid-associated protein YgaU